MKPNFKVHPKLVQMAHAFEALNSQGLLVFF